MKGFKNVLFLSVITFIVGFNCFCINSYATEVTAEAPIVQEEIQQEPIQEPIQEQGIVEETQVIALSEYIKLQDMYNALMNENNILKQQVNSQNSMPVQGQNVETALPVNVQNTTEVQIQPEEVPTKKAVISNIEDVITKEMTLKPDGSYSSGELTEKVELSKSTITEDEPIKDINLIPGETSEGGISENIKSDYIDIEAINSMEPLKKDENIYKNKIEELKIIVLAFYAKTIEFFTHLSTTQIILFVSVAVLLIALCVLIVVFFKYAKKNNLLFYKHFASEEEEVVDEQMLNETFA